ncbi:MAG: metallophosphoesterase [Cyanobacteria bacterium P01_A01_bin.80]
MKVITEPPISVKIDKMNQRVSWLHPSITSRGIDQTSMVIDDGKEESPEFSFMVIGDSGAGDHWGHNPQRQIAELMLPHRDDCRFVLHTGDVIYLVGSQDYYYPNFIKPYREFLVNGENYKSIRYDNMVFNQPFLPVLGNHDYYDVPLAYRILAGATLPIRRAFGYKELDISWHGSYQGDAYAKAFIDYLQRFRNKEKLGVHLDKRYTGKTDSGRCLRYLPGEFTRLPNRYYSFRYGGIDFFALDSSTFNTPLPIPTNSDTQGKRTILEKRSLEIEQEEQQILLAITELNSESPDDAEKIDDFNAKLEQLIEVKMDIEKQLNIQEEVVIDIEQLNWFKQRLIASWNNPHVRGRIVYFHHPPYVTEATKWHQGQTLAVRDRLREVFDGVVEELGELPPGRPVVDLILSGHAHCFEHLQTFDTGHADSHLNCIIAGGSGFSLRRQREEGAVLEETFTDSNGVHTRKVARCNLFLGRNGQGSDKHRPYSFVRIDVKDGTPPKFIVKPFVADRHHHHWEFPKIQPFTIN